MANKQRNARKEQFWRDALKRRAASGLSVRAFCRRARRPESGAREVAADHGVRPGAGEGRAAVRDGDHH